MTKPIIIIMKKTYEQPEIEVIKFELNAALTLEDGGAADGEVGPTVDFGDILSSVN